MTIKVVLQKENIHMKKPITINTFISIDTKTN